MTSLGVFNKLLETSVSCLEISLVVVLGIRLFRASEHRDVQPEVQLRSSWTVDGPRE
jgi:hypothetical protein